MNIVLVMYQALEADIGIAVSTSDPHQLRAKLYSERRKQKAAGVDDFDALSFRISPKNPDKELWIQKGDKNAET